MPHIRNHFASSQHYEQTVQPLVMGRKGAVSSGHFSATAAGHHMLSIGGNAIDAGVAAGIALNVMLFHLTSFGGVAPIMIYHAPTKSLVTLDGLGVWPALASMDHFQTYHNGQMPRGVLRAITPGAPDAWLTALAHYGTLTLAEVMEPAYQLAAKGAPVSVRVAMRLQQIYEGDDGLDIGGYATMDPEAQRIFFPGGKILRAGEVLVQEDLGNTLKSLMDEETRARQQGACRREAILGARDLFYQGWMADKIGAYHEKHGGWIRYRDLANHRVEVARPLHTTYHGYDVYTCGPWCQGPLLIQFVNILENFDLDSLSHNSSEYLHLVLEAMNLAFSDRENFYGDPRQVEVPIAGLTSKAYARQQAQRIDALRAWGHMPDPGNPWLFQGDAGRSVQPVDINRYLRTAPGVKEDTSYAAAGDQWGNLFSATPSDPVFTTPIIPGLGLSCSGRGYQSRIHPGHPSAVAPGKRPRLTPNPAMIGLNEKPLMAFGCPGGDAQTQGMLQVFLNLVHAGANLQAAIERPRAISLNFPSSFAPFTYFPGRVDLEGRIPAGVGDDLARLGHEINECEAYSGRVSAVHAVAINRSNGVLLAGADPRSEGAAWGQ